MLGERHTFDRVPFFWTTHFGNRFEYLGYTREWDSMKMLGSFDNKRFAVLWRRRRTESGAELRRVQ